MNGDWFMKSKLMAYDSSFKDILAKTFKASFKEVIFTDKVPQNELTLQVSRLYPYWNLAGSKMESFGGSGSFQNSSVSRPLYVSSFEIEAKIFYNGVEMNQLQAKSVSSFTTSGVTGTAFRKEAKRSFTEGLLVAAQDLYKATVTEDLMKKLK
jgi:hypothetical protein